MKLNIIFLKVLIIILNVFSLSINDVVTKMKIKLNCAFKHMW